MLSDPAYVRSAEQAEQAYLSAQAEQNSPQQVQARDASASAFDDLSGVSAQQLAQQQFPDLMTGDLDALQLPSGVQVDKYLSPQIARVVNGDGKRSLVFATEPLAAQDASGDLHRVDLSLQSSGDHYVAANSAADVEIAHRADDYTTVGGDGGLGVRPGDAPDAAGQQQDDRVFYPEVDTDTDFVSMPTRSGLEMVWQLRSEHAAQSLPLDLDLPAGASVRLASSLTAPVGAAVGGAGAGVEVVRDGTVLDTITAPIAVDADGTPVAAAYRLDGDQLVVDVEHQGKDLKYPIAVDPEVHEVWGGVDFNNGCNTPGTGNWHYQTFVTALDAYCTNGTPGLYVQSGPGIYYGDGAAGQWWWGTPASVHIISAWLDGLFHVPQATNFYDGIYQSDHGWEVVHNFAGGMQNAQDSFGGVGWDMNYVVFGMSMQGAGGRGGYGLAAIRGANIRIGDSWSPQWVKLDRLWVNGVNVGLPNTYAGNDATPWIRGNSAITAQVSARDTGLGIYHLGIDQTSGGDYLFHHLENCNGSRGAPCSVGAVESGTMNFGQLKGIITLRTFASDITDNLVHGPQWVARIDRDNPRISVSGEVVDHAQDGTLGPNPVLHVTVTDGNASSLAAYQSGVRRVLVSVDGTTLPLWTNPNVDATNNDFSLDYTLPTTTDGTHPVHITAWDDAGNPPGTYDLSYVERANTSWTYGGADRSVNTADEATTVAGLLAGTGYQSVWDGLSTADKNYMLAGLDEPDMANWAGRIDTTPPASPYDLDVQYYNAATHTATISWTEGEDPDLSSTLSGSMTAEGKASYRFKRAGGAWSSWRSTVDASFDLGSLDPGDTLSVQVADYDRAGNQSAALSDTVAIPTGPKASASIAFAIPVLACVEWCPVIVAGVGTVTTSAVWTINHKDFGAKHWPSSRDVAITRMDDDEPSFEDWDAAKGRERAKLGHHGEAVEPPADRSAVSPHHAVAVGARAALYARWIMWKCGLDPNNWFDNGIWLPRKIHQRMHGPAYYQAINDMLKEYHPTFGSDPCGENSGGIDLTSNGLRRAMRDIKQYIKDNYIPR